MKHFRYILLFKGLFEINLTISLFAFTNNSVTVVAVVVDIWQPASNSCLVNVWQMLAVAQVAWWEATCL